MKKKPKKQIPMNSPEYHAQFRKKLENFLNGTNSQPIKNAKIDDDELHAISQPYEADSDEDIGVYVSIANSASRLKTLEINNKAVATWQKKKARPKQGWAFVPMNRLFKLRKINVRNKSFSRVALQTGYLKYRKLRCLQPLLEWYPPSSEYVAGE